jgi:hypothetical protein
VALRVVADGCAIEHVEGGEQGLGAVTHVVMRHRAGAATLRRQPCLGMIERLDLALFVPRAPRRGRIDVKADNVLEFLGKLRIVQQLERVDAVQRDLMSLKNPLHRSQDHAGRFGQHPTRSIRSFPQRGGPSASCTTRCKQGQLARFASLVTGQAGNALPHEALLPAPQRRLGLNGSPLKDYYPMPWASPKYDTFSVVPQPSDVARMILARQTSFCGAFRTPAIASS